MRPMAKRLSPCHVLRPVAGADTASIFVEAPVEDVVHRLDGPVPSIEGKQAFLRRGPGGQAGDAVSRLAAVLAGFDLDGFAGHGENLSDAGEVEIVVEFAGDPDGSPLAAAVFGLGALVGEVRLAPGDVLVEQEADVVMQGLLVSLDGEQIIRAAVE